jgi:O-antigen/teichoic acid export membrane protein
MILESIQEKINKNTKLRLIINNINWLTFGILLRNFVGILVIAFIARNFGPEKFGLMNYALAFVALFSIFSTLGLDDLVIRELVNKPQKRGDYLGSTFFLKSLGSILMVLFSLIAIIVLEKDSVETRSLVLILSLGYLFKPFDVIDFFFQSEVNSKLAVLSRSYAFIFTTFVRILMVIKNVSLVTFMFSYTLDLFLIAVFLVYFYSRKNHWKEIKLRLDKFIIIELLKNSWPLFLASIAIILYMKIDQIFIGIFLGDEALGLYSSAAKISEAWYFLPVIIMSSVFPAILSAKRKDKNLYKQRLETLYGIFTWFTIFVACIVTFTAPLIIRILYGVEYSGASSVLALHIWAGVGVFLGTASSKYLISENLTKISLYRTVIGAILNIILNILLIPRFGIVGAAMSTVISYIVSTFSVLLFPSSRDVGISMLKSFNIFKTFNNLVKMIR